MLFHGPSPHHVSLWDNFGGLLRPRGKTYTPLRGMISLSLIASSNVVIHKFLRNSRSALQPVEVCRHALSMRFFARFFANCTISINPSLRKDIATRVRIVRRYGASFEFVELKL